MVRTELRIQSPTKSSRKQLLGSLLSTQQGNVHACRACASPLRFTWPLMKPFYQELKHHLSSVQSLIHVRLFVTMNRSTADFPVHHQLPESTQTHVHWVSDAIQPSHPLSSPSPPVLNLSQHQGLFKWVSSSHQVAKVLEFQLQRQSFQWTPRTDLL